MCQDVFNLPFNCGTASTSKWARINLKVHTFKNENENSDVTLGHILIFWEELIVSDLLNFIFLLLDNLSGLKL